jgi:ribokinase
MRAGGGSRYDWGMTPVRPIFVLGSLVIACSARVERCPAAGETIRATDFIMELGGKGFNFAVAALRLGVPVDGMFAIGDDRLGAFARGAFIDAGLSVDMLVSVSGATGAGIGLIEPGGDNRIAVFPAANERLSAVDVQIAASRISGAALVLAQFELSDAPIAAGFALARLAAIPTLLNPSPYRTIAPEILQVTDILVVNESEARALAADLGIIDASDAVFWTGPERALASRLDEMGVGTLVVTRGAGGATVWSKGHGVAQPAFAVDAIDAIGAGDAFIGGFSAAFTKNYGLSTALRWGCGAGALAVAQIGLLGALPDLAELTAFLAKAPIIL